MTDTQDTGKILVGRLRKLAVHCGDLNLETALEAVARALADALDPPPEPEPEIRPGELVLADGEYILITSDEGMLWTKGNRAPPNFVVDRIATQNDVEQWAKRFPGSLFSAFQCLARLLVSQEQPPELKGEDREKYVVTEKRPAFCGERFVNPWSGNVAKFTCADETALRVWIVKPKEDTE